MMWALSSFHRGLFAMMRSCRFSAPPVSCAEWPESCASGVEKLKLNSNSTSKEWRSSPGERIQSRLRGGVGCQQMIGQGLSVHTLKILFDWLKMPPQHRGGGNAWCVLIISKNEQFHNLLLFYLPIGLKEKQDWHFFFPYIVFATKKKTRQTFCGTTYSKTEN